MSSKLETLGFKKAETTRSIVWFAVRPNILISRRILDLFVKEAGSKNARLCLHKDPSAKMHDMIILEHAGKTYPAHRHPTKSETLHMIYGMIRVHIYDDKNDYVQNFDLVAGSIFRIEAMTYHKNEAISNTVIYHETKTGPFDATVDNEIAAWEKVDA